MIVVTGAAGFIGSVVTGNLNSKGHKNLVLVDDFNRKAKELNFNTKHFSALIDRNLFFDWFNQNAKDISYVIHLGARTDTTEFNRDIFDELNVSYSKSVWELCTKYKISLIYASSAATYGLGEFGYSEDISNIYKLKPLNPYGESKNDFDKWALQQVDQPPFWAGLKFFNVYGPNEYHKARMASVIFHAFHQIKNTGKVKLFKSHRPEFEDGKQLRDFVYVKDVADVISFLISNKPESGIYNLGTGQARTFYDLALATFAALKMKPEIEFIDTPIDIRDKYQYFTEAEMKKLRETGYPGIFTSLEDGVNDYVTNYLIGTRYF
ncbi:MAG: ADP-glyceromanno-heptose 6-epimerase [Bacteroidales bacterium]|nr:ADP-glyceromanno-heptose 6-epimerase [Bacteroidales bacterium]